MNSPGSAILAPYSVHTFNNALSTACPPCPCNSTTSSPVKEWGLGKYKTMPWSMTSLDESRKL